MSSEKVNKRARNWGAIVYPDSAPEDWRDTLDALHIPWACSPLHDSDCNPDGEIKKAHWHIVLAFAGMKSFEQVKSITDSIGAPIPQVIQDMRGAVRYFVHLDNPSKFQYNPSDIDARSGFDAIQYLEATTTQKRESLKDILKFCRQESIFEYADLIDRLLADGLDDWFVVATERNTLAITQYLKSARYRKPATPNSDTTASPSV